jgi:hypothetical protein
MTKTILVLFTLTLGTSAFATTDDFLNSTHERKAVQIAQAEKADREHQKADSTPKQTEKNLLDRLGTRRENSNYPKL